MSLVTSFWEPKLLSVEGKNAYKNIVKVMMLKLHFSHVVDVVAAVVVVAVVDVTAVVTIHGGRQIIRESPFSSTMYYFCIATISCWTKFALLLKQFFPVRSLPRTELSLGMLMPHPKVRERAFSYFKVTFNFFIVVEEWKEECEPKRVYRNVSFSKCPNCRESPGSRAESISLKVTFSI